MQHKWLFFDCCPSLISCRVPQGSNLGRPLFLIYINDLPKCLTSASARMVADDTNITYAASTIADLEKVVNSVLRKLNCWLVINRLSLNVARTNFLVIGSNQRIHALLNNQINIDIDGKFMEKVKETKSLGLVIGEHLPWTRHIGKYRQAWLAKVAHCCGIAYPFIYGNHTLLDTWEIDQLYNKCHWGSHTAIL